MIRMLILAISSAILFATAIVCSHKHDHDHRPPNILIILADDLGWGDVSFHGSQQIPTPNLDLLASNGVMLSNYYVMPLCSPSRSALLTGRHPIRTGMQVGVIAASEPYGLPLNFTTMGQHFLRIGYQTHLVGKWHQGLFRREYLPTNRGFETYLGYLTGHADYYNRMAGDYYRGFDLQEMDQNANLTRYEGQYSTDMYTNRVVKLIEENAAAATTTTKPWLIYFAQQSVHGAEVNNVIEPPKRHENDHQYIKLKDRRRRFAGMVSALDESVGRVFRALNDTDQLDRTIILFSTDNGGTSAGKNGHFIDDGEGSNWPLKGGKYTLWEGGVRGTAFVWSKHLKPRISNQLMHISDVLPTLYAAAGGDPEQLGDIDGVNQWPKLQNRTENPEDDYEIRSDMVINIDHQLEHFWAVRYRNYKLTNGTYGTGNFDYWYEAPGQNTEHPPGGICYNCSDVYAILQQMNHGKLDPTLLKVDCQHLKNPMVECTPDQMCLFDLERDPCELNNLAAKRPDLVKKIYEQVFLKYDQQYAEPVNRESDPNANPALHRGFWEPWQS